MKNPTPLRRLSIGIVDQHTFFRQMLQKFLEDTALYNVIVSVDSGILLIENIDNNTPPDIVFLSSEKDSIETACRINMAYPDVKTVFFCEKPCTNAIRDALAHMVKGILLKSCSSDEILHALSLISRNNHYITPALHNNVAEALRMNGYVSTSTPPSLELNEKERRFMQLLCSELELKDIASQMHLGSRSIEYYRNSLYKKLNVKTRTGAVIYCIRNQLIAV